MEEKSYKIIYIIGLIFSSITMLWVLIFGIFTLNITFLIFFWVIKFLSGFGLILGIANGFFAGLNIILGPYSDKKIGEFITV